ncbi:MAG: DUF881 domain-containing protein [Marmoricola sp.]
MGLLPYINAHAIDEDYAVAATRRGPREDVPTRRRRVGRGGAAVLAVFAILAVTAAVQTSKDSVSEEKDRRALITQVKDRRDAVIAQRRSITKLQQQNAALQSALLRASDDADGVTGRLSLLGLRSGTAAAKGPGVEVVVDDAPDAANDRNKVLDSDLQKLVNGMWEAGAEAISINGQRLTALSAIRFAGTAISVNFVSLQRPYRVLAIGNPDTLQGRFGATTSGAAWFDLQRDVGLKFSMHRAGSLRLPAAPMPSLRYVDVGTDRTGPGGTKGRDAP